MLRKALKDDDPRVRLGAAIALREIGAPAKAALPDLLIALNDKSVVREHGFDAPAVRYQAAQAIVSIDPKQELVVPILVEALADQNPVTRISAAESLGKMGAIAQAAVPNLEHALAADSDGLVRVFAAHALGEINGSNACAVLTRLLKTDKDASVRARAARVIATLRPTCSQASPALIDALADRSTSAIDTLAKLGKPAVPALTEALKSPDLYVREDAVKALAGMEPLPDEAVQALIRALGDKSFKVSSEAARALQDVGGEAERAALAEQDREERYYAEQSRLDTKLYTKAQIAANIPPDNEHKYPLELEYLYPIFRSRDPGHASGFLISLHRGKERGERLVFWRIAGDGKYRQTKVIETDEETGPDNMGLPMTFTATVQEDDRGRPHEQLELFVDIPRYAWRNQSHQVFLVAGGDLLPVEIESPGEWYGEWYKDKLRPGETIWDYPANFFKVVKEVCDTQPIAIADVPLDPAPSVKIVQTKKCSPEGAVTYKMVV
ncbi:MAG: HEAT repeat domain-containing protein, partial [Burkholderiales bacterium]